MKRLQHYTLFCRSYVYNMTMKITYIFPIVLFILLVLFMIKLPNLRTCNLPSLPQRESKKASHRAKSLPPQLDCKKNIDRYDLIIMAVIMFVYGCIAFIGLGNRNSPESFAVMENESAAVELSGDNYPSKIMLFSGVGEGRYAVEFSEDGENWENAGEYEQNYISVLKWNTFIPSVDFTPKYVRFTGLGPVYLGEVAMFDGDGEQIVLSHADDCPQSVQITDEQDTAQSKQHFMNSTYFDEIYHPRTAWEHLNGIKPYEVSHPPLGKLLIALGVSIFGMNPFGWRFMGTFFGVLMLPIIYIFSKKMFGGRSVPTAAALLLASDFMHFVQTRIATIDTYGVFFTLLMYLFMYLFLERENEGSHRRALLFLALSGVSFGLGAASKWTGIYAGAGLALIWLLFWVNNKKSNFKAFAKNALFCVVFFVIVPALIYYVSYAAYGVAAGMHGIGMFFKKEYLNIVLENQQFMFSYHSGLVAEHPYASKWYQWMLDIRPILYYLEYYEDGTRSSFGAFVNPVLCWGGLLSLFVLVYTTFARDDRQAGFILVGYFSQLLPWVLVSRLTFAYHYFPCTVFLVLSLAYVFKLMRLNSKHWRICVGGFVLVSVLVFIMFYPALSGMKVDNILASKLLSWLPTWPF